MNKRIRNSRISNGLKRRFKILPKTISKLYQSDEDNNEDNDTEDNQSKSSELSEPREEDTNQSCTGLFIIILIFYI